MCNWSFMSVMRQLMQRLTRQPGASSSWCPSMGSSSLPLEHAGEEEGGLNEPTLHFPFVHATENLAMGREQQSLLLVQSAPSCLHWGGGKHPRLPMGVVRHLSGPGQLESDPHVSGGLQLPLTHCIPEMQFDVTEQG